MEQWSSFSENELKSYTSKAYNSKYYFVQYEMLQI